MPTFSERNMTFTFPEDWHPISYEQSETHLEKMMPLQNTHAVDFLCCHQDRLVLIEAKRYTERPIKDVQHLVNEIAWQFKDTLCGIALCHVRGEAVMKLYSDALLPQQPREHHKLEVFLEIQNETPLLPKATIQTQVFQSLRTKFVRLGFTLRLLDSTRMRNHPWTVEVH